MEIGGPPAKFQGDTSGAAAIQWDGVALILTTDTENSHGGAMIHKVERWELSADGKMLTSQVTTKSSHGTFEAKFVFDRQP